MQKMLQRNMTFSRIRKCYQLRWCKKCHHGTDTKNVISCVGAENVTVEQDTQPGAQNVISWAGAKNVTSTKCHQLG